MKLEFLQTNDFELLSKEIEEIQKMIFVFTKKLKN